MLCTVSQVFQWAFSLGDMVQLHLFSVQDRRYSLLSMMLVMCLRISGFEVLGVYIGIDGWAIGKAVCLFEGLASGNGTNCEQIAV